MSESMGSLRDRFSRCSHIESKLSDAIQNLKCQWMKYNTEELGLEFPDFHEEISKMEGFLSKVKNLKADIIEDYRKASE